MVVKIDNNQTPGWNYLLDTRSGFGLGYFADQNFQYWPNVTVNNKSTVTTWVGIPKDKWTHLYLESPLELNNDINIFSRFSNNETLAGYLPSLEIYNCPKQ